MGCLDEMFARQGLSISKTASLDIAYLPGTWALWILILFEAKKIRFDHNSIDLLLSKDAGGGRNLLLACLILASLFARSAWHDAKLKDQNGGDPPRNSTRGHVGQPQWCASLLGGPGVGGGRGGWEDAWAHGRGRPRRRARCVERERARASCAIARLGLRSRPAGVGPRACASAAGVCRAFESCDADPGSGCAAPPQGTTLVLSLLRRL